jgi:glycosyltransferase involved in cell wall biosynthesis
MLIPKPPPRLVSLVIPIYNEEDVFPLLRAELTKVKASLAHPVEIILVDDGSADASYALMHAWAEEDPDIKILALSRNFGHQIAITAGMDASSGDAVVIMDADLQDPPALIPEMIAGYCAGYDVVYGQRTVREGETRFKLWTAALFYFIMRKAVDRRLPANTGDFRLVSRQVIDDFRRIREHDRFMRGLVAWVGYRQLALPYVRSGRAAGTTKYPFFRMLRFAMTAILSFSNLPLQIITWLGFASVLVSFAFIVRTLVQYVTEPATLVLGWASLAVLISFFSGVILVSIGILGIYVGKIHTEVQDRPLYLVRHAKNLTSAGRASPTKEA